MYKKTIQYFEEVSKIPRCSKHEEKIRDWLLSRAGEQGYTSKTDTIGNVVIFVDASEGREDEEILILQGHMDMVCVKEQGSTHDFSKDAIEMFACDKGGRIQEDGTWITAKGTTLGADNGIGLAMCLAATHGASHPPLELLFTVDEEQGLTGALELDVSLLKGKKLINLDTEDLGEICISSAGGGRIDIVLPITLVSDSLDHYKFHIIGMKGGHSGVDIDKKRGNAILTWIELVSGYDGEKSLVGLKGGVADNALPSFCEGVIGIANEQEFREYIEVSLNTIKDQYDCPDIGYTLTPNISTGECFISGEGLLDIIQQVKVGIHSMSEKIENLVQTSINLGMIESKNTALHLTYAPRSSVMSELDDIIKRVKDVYTQAGGKVTIRSQYPGWQEDPKGELVQIVKNVYEEVLGNDVTLVAYHAGLECGALVEKLGVGAEAVSFGPTILDPHSPHERCDLEAVKKCCRVVEIFLAHHFGSTSSHGTIYDIKK